MIYYISSDRYVYKEEVGIRFDFMPLPSSCPSTSSCSYIIRLWALFPGFRSDVVAASRRRLEMRSWLEA